jgi:uncharacterized protein (UPF0332 family)
MSLENFILNSESNKKIALYARNEGKFNASVSRYYYSLFQSIKYVVLKTDPHYTTPEGKGSHDHLFYKFRKIVTCELTKEERGCLSSFQDIKKLRKRADYDPEVIGSEVFYLEFLDKYKPLKNAVDKTVKNRKPIM